MGLASDPTPSTARCIGCEGGDLTDARPPAGYERVVTEDRASGPPVSAYACPACRGQSGEPPGDTP